MGQPRMTGSETVAEVEWLLDGGVPPWLIVDILHRSATGIAKLGRAYGKPEVARPFERLDRRVAA